jgi:REP element-mobilizing transposase RayT
MQTDEPLAYFITWTVYGTFLQGDIRGWRRRRSGQQLPQPKLADWHNKRLNHPIMLLDEFHKLAIENEIQRLAKFRQWHVWTCRCQHNHVHVVVTATEHNGDIVRDQMKANCTRVLRESWLQFVDRPVWTKGGDWECINSEDDLEQVVLYVDVAQDRKHLDRE